LIGITFALSALINGGNKHRYNQTRLGQKAYVVAGYFCKRP